MRMSARGKGRHAVDTCLTQALYTHHQSSVNATRKTGLRDLPGASELVTV